MKTLTISKLIEPNDITTLPYCTTIKYHDFSRSKGWSSSFLLPLGRVAKRSLDDCFEKITEEDDTVFTAKDTKDCTKSVDIVLQSKGAGNTLEDLTGNYFNGETYVVRLPLRYICCIILYR